MTSQFPQVQLQQRLDVAKGEFTMPDDIDAHNAEVVALFLVKHNHATFQSIEPKPKDCSFKPSLIKAHYQKCGFVVKGCAVVDPNNNSEFCFIAHSASFGFFVYVSRSL